MIVAALDTMLENVDYVVMEQPLPPLPYKFTASDRGTCYWSCPKCGHVNRVIMRHNRVHVRCNEPNCRTHYVLGRILWFLPHGGDTTYSAPDSIVGGRLRGRRAPIHQMGTAY